MESQFELHQHLTGADFLFLLIFAIVIVSGH